MTNAIGTGTVNFPLNMPTDARARLGRKAFDVKAKSLGAYCRKLILLGLEKDDPATAAEVREIFRRYYGAGLACLALFVSINGWFSPDAKVMRRQSARVSVVRVVRGRTEMEAA